MAKIFISYAYSNDMSHGYGNCWLESDGLIDSIEKIRGAEDSISKVSPDLYHRVTILNWRRFEEGEEKSDKSIGRMIQTMKGLKCSHCGDAPSIDDTRWRWNGETWAHKCGDAQAGHFRAVKKESEEGE